MLISQVAMLADRILVTPTDERAREKLELIAEKEGYHLVRNSPYSPLFKVVLPDAGLNSIPVSIELITISGKGSLTAEPDYLYFPGKTPDDLFLETQYALERIEAFSAWEFSTGSSQVVVAVIDSGIDLDHPDLVESLWTNPGDSSFDGQDNDGNGFIDDINGWDFRSNDNTPEGMTNHGTHVSGIIGANGDNGVGVAGVNWSIGLISLRVGSSVFPTSNIIAALEYVKFLKEERGIPIVATNNSYGSSSLSSALQSGRRSAGGGGDFIRGRSR